MAERKNMILRLDPAVHDALAKWAADEMRSTNAQIEFILRRALGDVGRMPRAAKAMRRPGRPAVTGDGDGDGDGDDEEDAGLRPRHHQQRIACSSGLWRLSRWRRATDMAPTAKILLVDDRSENLLALEAILSSLGQELVCARSGEAALAALLADEFAVILMDVVMPGMDGFETAAHIKRRVRTHDVPIIFLTAAGAEPDLAFRGYAAGAVDYITKPFDPWVLRAKVSVFVDLHLKDRKLRLAAELSSRLTAVEDAAAALARLPGMQADGARADPALAAGLTELDGAVAMLRRTIDAFGVRGQDVAPR